MKISYRKDLEHTTMVLSEIPDFNDDDFCTKMLMRSNAPCLLHFETEILDGSQCLIYDISAKQSFENAFKSEPLTFSQLILFLDSLKGLSEVLCAHLLNPDNILFRADTVFLDRSRKNFYFCCLPFANGDFYVQLHGLFNQILSIIDYDDEQAVALAFSLNRICQGPNYTLKDLLSVTEKISSSSLPEEDTEPIFTVSADIPVVEDVSPYMMPEAFPAASADNSFMAKARKYMNGKKFSEVFDDINSCTIIKKIRNS